MSDHCLDSGKIVRDTISNDTVVLDVYDVSRKQRRIDWLRLRVPVLRSPRQHRRWLEESIESLSAGEYGGLVVDSASDIVGDAQGPGSVPSQECLGLSRCGRDENVGYFGGGQIIDDDGPYVRGRLGGRHDERANIGGGRVDEGDRILIIRR